MEYKMFDYKVIVDLEKVKDKEDSKEISKKEFLNDLNDFKDLDKKEQKEIIDTNNVSLLKSLRIAYFQTNVGII